MFYQGVKTCVLIQKCTAQMKKANETTKNNFKCGEHSLNLLK